MMGSEITGGWWWPSNSRKAHYLTRSTGGFSLCRKWAALAPFSSLDLEQGNDDSPDNCAACRRRKPAGPAQKEALDDG